MAAANQSQGLCVVALGRVPAQAGTRSESDLQHELNSQPSWRGPAPLRHAHEDMLFAMLAGADLLRALAQILVRPHGLAVAPTAIARAGIEVYARVHFLDCASDARDLAWRAASLAHSDSFHQEVLRPEASLRGWDGNPRDVPEYRAAIRSFLQAQGLPAPRRIGLADLAADVLAHSVPSNSISQEVGKQIYSDLSAIAHGASIGINGFVRSSGRPTSDSAGSVWLEPSLPIIAAHAGYVLSTCLVVTEDLIERFGLSAAEVRDWENTRDRIWTTFREGGDLVPISAEEL